MKIADVEMSVVEFLWKVVVILGFVVPICIGGTALVFYSISSHLNFLATVSCTALGAVIGTIAALFVTAAIIKIGHKGE